MGRAGCVRLGLDEAGWDGAGPQIQLLRGWKGWEGSWLMGLMGCFEGREAGPEGDAAAAATHMPTQLQG